MKKVAALIDFTTVSDVVARFASRFAIEKQVEIEFIHISAKDDVKTTMELTEKLKAIVSNAENEGAKASFQIHYGSFFSVIAPVLKNANSDLVIIGTHGKKGLMQNIFGSHILRLVQMVGIPSLVIQENSKWPEHGFKKALSPISSHDNFDVQVEQTFYILSEGSEIDLYAIHKSEELEESAKQNLRNGVELLNKLGVKHSIKEEESTLYSVGYAKQTIAYLQNNPYDLVSIMSQISEGSKYFGEMDKENIIFNPMGLPVLCCDK
jgi:nucleotide-binding universal stress UspA family protein